MSRYLHIYRALLYLYPADYRREYETEMIQLFDDLLRETPTRRQRFALLVSTITETAKWAPPELMEHAETSVATAPRFIKLNTFLALLCVAPFLLVYLYHLHTLYDQEARPALLNL